MIAVTAAVRTAIPKLEYQSRLSHFAARRPGIDPDIRLPGQEVMT